MYVKWTIQNILYQTRRKNPLVYKGLIDLKHCLLYHCQLVNCFQRKQLPALPLTPPHKLKFYLLSAVVTLKNGGKLTKTWEQGDMDL